MPEKSAAKRENAARNRENAAGGAARRRLAGRRKALGLTQEALAALMGVERTTIVRWERGETAPVPPIRPKLARALRVSADRLEELLTPGTPAGPEAGSSPRQLPPAVAGFTGRAAELAELTKILDEAGGAAGTVVISAIGGTAGVGKTALAIQWAHQAAHRFPDGQLYVNLRGYDPDRPVPPADALAGFLRALGVAGQDIPPEEDERAARYRSVLAGRRILVVLDNAGSSDQARPLLPGSPTCAVLVTSRDSLTGLVARDGATRLDLDLLPLPDAMRLLRGLIGDRAVADPGATEALAERCCRLPLALRVAAELAVARPVVPLADLADELAGQQQRLDLLDAGGDPRTAVRAVFSWSYEHLDAGTARAFRLAGLHPAADFDGYAAAALTDATVSQARRMLDVLVRVHLVQPAGGPGPSGGARAPGPGRYAMHDLLRAYAAELAAARDGDHGQRQAMTRLLDYYLSTTASAMDALYPAERQRRPRVDPAGTPAPLPDAAAAQAWLDGERPALTAVAQHAAARGWPDHATRLSATVERHLDAGGHYPEAILIHTSALLAARQQGDCAAEGAAMRALGSVDGYQGRFTQAAQRFLASRDLYREAGDRVGEALALANLGAAHHQMGDYQQAIDFYGQALSVQREIGDRAGEGITLGNLGYLMGLRGRYQQATQFLQQSLVISRDIGDRFKECYALAFLGEVALLQGEHQRADNLLRQALALSRAADYRHREHVVLTVFAELRRDQGRTREAAEHLREALAICRELGERDGESVALNRLGEVQLAAGQPGDARDQHAAALALATENGNRPEQGRAHEGLGNAHHALGDTNAADRHWRAALAIYTDLDVPETARVRARLDEKRPGRTPGPPAGPGVVPGE